MTPAENMALQADPLFWIVSFVLYCVVVALMAYLLDRDYKPSTTRLVRFVVVMLAGFGLFYLASRIFGINVLL